MKLHRLTIAASMALLHTGAVGAQDANDKAMEAGKKLAEKAAMEAWQKFGTPSEGHQKLAGMVGTWDAEVAAWPDPAAPPMKSTGSSVNRLVLGGRWVESQFTNGPFEGLGYTGYNNFKKKYVGTWMDNMTTGVLVSEGTFDSAGKVMTQMSTMDDVVTGKPASMRMVTTLVTPDEHLMEMFGPDPMGKEVKQMEIRYKRRK